MMIVGVLLLLGYICVYTPYPFVLLLRHQKEEHKNKAPDHIEELKQHVRLQTACTYPSRYPNHTYDLYMPNDKKASHVLIWIHGGAFIAGTSAGAKNFAIQLANHGVIVVAMNYAYAPKYPFPTQVKQVDELLCHIKKELVLQGLPEQLPYVIGGDSAGANIAFNFTNHQLNEALRKESNLHFQSTQTIQGQILFCGPYDFCEDFHQEQFQKFARFFKYIGWSYLGSRKWEQLPIRKFASPIHYLSEQHPPMYIVDGKKFSFLWQGKRLVEVGKQLQLTVMSDFYEECPHEFQFDYQAFPIEATTVLKHTIQFLNEHCQGEGN